MSSPGDSLSVKVAGPQVGIILFKHDWNGIAEVVVGEQVHTVDLFSATPMHWLLEVPLPSSQEAIPLKVRASGKKNDASHAGEVWVEGIYVCNYLTSELEERIHESVQQPPFQEADLNQLTDVFKWYDPEWMAALESLKMSPSYQPPDFVHRKAWEWGQCLYGLDWLGMLRPEHRALGIGVGWEPISFFLSNHLGEVIATDLYPVDTHWSDSGAREGSPDILENPDKYAPFPYRKDRLRFMRMDGTRLDFPDESFDVVWSCSSIEHFGGHGSAARSMREIERVLKPGGVAAIITEFVLPDRIGGGHSSFHPEFFNLQCLYHYLIRPVPRLHLVQDIDFSIPSYYVRRACRLPEEAGAPHKGSTKPHIVLSQGGCLFTSIAMFFRKEGALSNDGSQQRLFATDGGKYRGSQIDSLQRQLQATQEKLRITQQRLQAIETSLTWQIGHKLALSWPGRALHYLVSRLPR